MGNASEERAQSIPLSPQKLQKEIPFYRYFCGSGSYLFEGNE
jgi:hypothetical protein